MPQIQLTGIEALFWVGLVKKMELSWSRFQSRPTISPWESQDTRILITPSPKLQKLYFRQVRLRAVFFHPDPLIGWKLHLRHDRLRTLGSNYTYPSPFWGTTSEATQSWGDRLHWTSPAKSLDKKTNKEKFMGKSESRVGYNILSEISNFYQKIWNIQRKFELYTGKKLDKRNCLWSGLDVGVRRYKGIKAAVINMLEELKETMIKEF